MSEGNDDYSVGYGRPPKNTRFQKGLSGNPKGRRKKPNELERVREILNEKMQVTIDGKDAAVTPVEAAARIAIKKGLSGNLRDLRGMTAFFRDIGVDIFSEEDRRELSGAVERTAAEELRKLREEMLDMDKYLDLMQPYREKHHQMILNDPVIIERQIKFWVGFLEEAPNDVAFKKRLEALKVEKWQTLMSENLIKQITRRYRERNGKSLKNRK